MHNLLFHSVPLLMLASGGIMYVAAKTDVQKGWGKRTALGSISSAVGTWLFLWAGWPTVALVWGALGLAGLGMFWFNWSVGAGAAPTQLLGIDSNPFAGIAGPRAI